MPERGKKRQNEGDGDSSQEEPGTDWRKSDRNHKLLAREIGVLTDITFEVGPDSIPFKVHKLILGLSSPVFEAMFFGSMAEKGDNIKVPDIFPDGFDHMLQFIYTEEVHFKSEVTALQAWIAADKYCINQLKEKCHAYLNICVLKSSNIWMILENSVFLNLTSLTNRCLNYFRSRYLFSLVLPGFLDTSGNTLEQVLLIRPTYITASQLLRDLLHWAKYKVVKKEAENLEALAPLLKYIPFGSVTMKEFSIFLSECENLISSQDAISIFQHISFPTRFKLPDWCLK